MSPTADGALFLLQLRFNRELMDEISHRCDWRLGFALRRGTQIVGLGFCIATRDTNCWVLHFLVSLVAMQRGI